MRGRHRAMSATRFIGPRTTDGLDASRVRAKCQMGTRGARPFYRIRSALGEPRSAFGAHAHKGWDRMVRGGCPVVLGVPFGTGPAHVIKFGPVRVEEAAGQVLQELGDIGQDARLLAVAGVASSYLFHDPLRRTFPPAPRSPRSYRAERAVAGDCPGKFVKN